mgnify:CR=1 FL=1
MTDFNDEDYWRSIILYGLNQATYKIALGKTLVSLSERNINRVSWDVLSLEFLEQYQKRLNVEEPMPQQANPLRRTFMERDYRENLLKTVYFLSENDELGFVYISSQTFVFLTNIHSPQQVSACQILMRSDL